MNLSDPIITSSQSPDREQKNGSFSLIERVILSAGAMLIFSGGAAARLAEATNSLTLVVASPSCLTLRVKHVPLGLLET